MFLEVFLTDVNLNGPQKLHVRIAPWEYDILHALHYPLSEPTGFHGKNQLVLTMFIIVFCVFVIFSLGFQSRKSTSTRRSTSLGVNTWPTWWASTLMRWHRNTSMYALFLFNVFFLFLLPFFPSKPKKSIFDVTIITCIKLNFDFSNTN